MQAFGILFATLIIAATLRSARVEGADDCKGKEGAGFKNAIHRLLFGTKKKLRLITPQFGDQNSFEFKLFDHVMKMGLRRKGSSAGEGLAKTILHSAKEGSIVSGGTVHYAMESTAEIMEMLGPMGRDNLIKIRDEFKALESSMLANLKGQGHWPLNLVKIDNDYGPNQTKGKIMQALFKASSRVGRYEWEKENALKWLTRAREVEGFSLTKGVVHDHFTSAVDILDEVLKTDITGDELKELALRLREYLPQMDSAMRQERAWPLP